MAEIGSMRRGTGFNHINQILSIKNETEIFSLVHIGKDDFEKNPDRRNHGTNVVGSSLRK